MNTQHPQTLKELQALYPYQFDGPHIGIEVAKGWMPIFAKLCANVDTVLGESTRGFYWVQVKEKFGSARFYYRYSGRNPNLRLDIQTPKGVLCLVVPSKEASPVDPDRSEREVDAAVLKLTVDAEEATQFICLACGKPGSRDSTGGYLLVLCPEHAALRRQWGRERSFIEWESPDMDSD